MTNPKWNWKPVDTEVIPTPFFEKECEGKTFEWLVINRPVFCKEVRDKFKDCTGFFKVLQTYLKNIPDERIRCD